MLRVLILSCLALASLAAPSFNPALEVHWQNFKNTFNKQYDDMHEVIRRSIWEKNYAFIRDHNLEADMGKHTFNLGINEYSDMTNEEFVKFMNGYQMTNETRQGAVFMAPSHLQDVATVDWRDQGYVTPVKNQGQCGSCWSFSATGSLEGQHFKKTGKLVSLSEQNLIDCSRNEGNKGCQGGLMDFAFKYIKENSGLDTEDSYPYEAKNDVCRFKRADVGASDVGYTDIRSMDEDALKAAVASIGPISVAIDASHKSFQAYRHGIYNEPACSSTKLDHGVLVVGYGTELGQDYWLVKNSWGESWGIEGYVKMARNQRNMCGIATQASYPNV